jgi:hypothetical protein
LHTLALLRERHNALQVALARVGLDQLLLLLGRARCTVSLQDQSYATHCPQRARARVTASAPAIMWSEDDCKKQATVMMDDE